MYIRMKNGWRVHQYTKKNRQKINGTKAFTMKEATPNMGVPMTKITNITKEILLTDPGNWTPKEDRMTKYRTFKEYIQTLLMWEQRLLRHIRE
eukprot:7779715-Ditylum_brightwellii.AAC.1